MKTLILGVLVLFTQPTFADSDPAAAQFLLNAITVCPEAQNPLMVLNQKGNGANSFTNADWRSQFTIQVDMMWDMQLLNPLIMTPVMKKGQMIITMTHPAPGYALVCKVDVEL